MLDKKLEILFQETGKQQADLAKFLKVAEPTVSQWKTGKRQPDLATVKKIAEFFNCTTDYLLGLTDSPEARIKPIISERDRKRAEIKKALLNLVSHDEGEFPIEDELIDTIYDAMMKGREFHTKRKQESNMKGDDK